MKNHTNKTIAAISISGPKGRFKNSRKEKLIKTVKENAKELSLLLGFKPLKKSTN